MLRTLTITGLKLLGFRASFLTHYRSTEQFSTSLAFLGAQNLIGWVAEITGQLLCTNQTKLWISYFEAGSTLPPPFNIMPTVKSFVNLLKRMRGKGKNSHLIPKGRTTCTLSAKCKSERCRYIHLSY